MPPSEPALYRSEPFEWQYETYWHERSLEDVEELEAPFEGGVLFIGFEWTQNTPYPTTYDFNLGPYLGLDMSLAPGDESWVYTLYSWETITD